MGDDSAEQSRHNQIIPLISLRQRRGTDCSSNAGHRRNKHILQGKLEDLSKDKKQKHGAEDHKSTSQDNRFWRSNQCTDGRACTDGYHKHAE